MKWRVMYEAVTSLIPMRCACRKGDMRTYRYDFVRSWRMLRVWKRR
jgi:hypothetical protein